MSHSLVALVDEFLAEVVVYLLGCDAVVSRQGAVDELRQLNGKERGKILFKTHRCKNADKNAESVGVLSLKTW